MSKLKVLHASHISNPTPPQGYGGIELVVDILARYQIREGLDVRVMGVKNPNIKTDYSFIQVFTKPIKQPSTRHKVEYMFKLVREAQRGADIVHLHVQWLLAIAPLLKFMGTPALLTLHADLKQGIIAYIAKKYNVPLIAISYTQKARLEKSGFRIYDFVYHGIEVEKYPFIKEKNDYLIYVGRIDWSKGVHVAIKVARMLSEKLVIIGTKADDKYFEAYVKPYIDGRSVVYLGEVDFETKVRYLSRAKALLYPVQYEEFFGIAMVEALACGTPVIGFARGSVNEIVKDGVTGFLCISENDIIDAIKKLHKLNPIDARKDAEARFSAYAMAHKYLKIYDSLMRRGLRHG